MIDTEFLITSLVVVLVPGTGVIYTISTGLLHGRQASMVAASGCTAGIVPHLTASMLGLSFILQMSEILFQGIKFAGVFYLIYLAWNMWREAGELTFDLFPTKSKMSSWQIAGKAILINLLNPKLTMFFFAFLPLFISPDTSSPLAEMLALCFIFMLMTLIVFFLYGILASSIRKYIVNSPRAIVWLQRSFAAAFVGLGMRLAVTE